mgnify:CR=1 FL=1
MSKFLSLLGSTLLLVGLWFNVEVAVVLSWTIITLGCILWVIIATCIQNEVDGVKAGVLKSVSKVYSSWVSGTVQLASTIAWAAVLAYVSRYNLLMLYGLMQVLFLGCYFSSKKG